MKNYIYVIALLIISTTSYSQAPAVQWQKFLGGSSFDYASSIQQTTDGGVHYVG